MQTVCRDNTYGLVVPSYAHSISAQSRFLHGLHATSVSLWILLGARVRACLCCGTEHSTAAHTRLLCAPAGMPALRS